jgi:hypothetical protein
MRSRWLTIFLVAGLAAGGAYYYLRHQTDSKLDIQTVAAKKGDVRRVVSTSGAVSALISVDIGSQLSGNISEVNVDYSSEVKKDQVLAASSLRPSRRGYGKARRRSPWRRPMWRYSRPRSSAPKPICTRPSSICIARRSW